MAGIKIMVGFLNTLSNNMLQLSYIILTIYCLAILLLFFYGFATKLVD
jgi:hypothetical protein